MDTWLGNKGNERLGFRDDVSVSIVHLLKPTHLSVDVLLDERETFTDFKSFE